MATLFGPAHIPQQDPSPTTLEDHDQDHGHAPCSQDATTHHSDQPIKVEQTRILGQPPSCLPSPSQSTSSSVDGHQQGDVSPSDSEAEVLQLAISVPQPHHSEHHSSSFPPQHPLPTPVLQETLSSLPHLAPPPPALEPHPIPVAQEAVEDRGGPLPIDDLQGLTQKLTQTQRQEQQEQQEQEKHIPMLSNWSPRSSTTRTTTRTERKHWSLDQLQMNGLRLPTVFPPLSSPSPTAFTTTTTAGELEHNSNHGFSGDGLGSCSVDGGGNGNCKTQFRHSSSGTHLSGKVLVTQRRTEPKGNSNSNRSSRSASKDSLPHARRNRNSHHEGQSQQQQQGRNTSMGDCHSTLQHSHQQNTQSEPLSARTESSAWVLPPIPTFEELGLRFDRSRTSSMNATVEGESLRAGSQQQQQEQQMQDQRDNHRGVTNALLQAAESSSSGVYDSGPGCRFSGEHAADEDDNVLVMPDMIPDSHPSIFDDILSDDNEAYIIWSTPPIRTKQQPPLSTSTAGPSSGGVSSVAALPESVKQPAGSDASSSAAAAATTQHQQQPSSSLDKGATSAGQDRSTKKQWSTIEPLNVRIKEANRSTDTLNSFGQSKPTKQDGSSTPTTITAPTSGSNLRPPKTPTTAATPATTTTATELQQKNRVIMAATVEKLVEKLTSEIDYTFLTDFFLIYRLFITPMALLKLIIVRFHWALVDDSPQRQIVRIRTFVTLRHWLLNYFEFDFMRSKDLRQTLGLYLRSLTKHPRVTNSMREQRIVKELRQYVQSLKTIHYRKLAQQKLERQSRKQQQQLLAERKRRLQARRSSAGRQGSYFVDRPWSGNNHSIIPQGQSSSNCSSVILGTPATTNRQIAESEALTEVLAVEFRSSDQSVDEYNDMDEDDDFDDDDEDIYDEDGDLYDDHDEDNGQGLYAGSGTSAEDDGFEPSSESSLYDSDYDSECSDSVEGEECHAEDSEQDEQRSTVETISGSDKNTEVEGLAISSAQQEEDLQSECHLPSPAFSPRSGKAKNQGGSGSFTSRLGPSASSSAASRTRARGTRPGLPDFQAGFNANNNNSMVNPSPLHQTSSGVGVGAGAGSRRGSRVKTPSRPLLTSKPLLSPSLSAAPLSPRGSLRSVEPYMNPPPRSVGSTEKKKPWSRYMSATVGRLSKMKRVFTSNAHKNDGRSEEGGGGSGTRSNMGFGRTRSDRYWRGNLSDPEGEKMSYLLACPGMNILLSNSEDRHGSFGRGGSRNKRRGRLNKEDGWSGWSSEGDYSQHEQTRQSNQEMLSNAGDQEEEPTEGSGNKNMSESSPFHDRLQHQHHSHHHSAAAYEQVSTPIMDGPRQFDNDVQEVELFDMDSETSGKSICSECEREQYFSSPAALQRPISLTVDTPDEDEEEDDKVEEGDAGSHTDPDSTPEECHCQGDCECTKDLDTADHPLTSGRVPNLRRTNQRNRQARDQRESWMTLSSTNSSMFGPLLNGNHLPPRQAIRQRGALGNVDRFVERFYNNQAGEAGAADSGLRATFESSEVPVRETVIAPPAQVQGGYITEPVSIHPLAVDTLPVSPLTLILASGPPFNNQTEGPRGLIQSQPSTSRPTSAMSPGRSHSQPNLLTTFSDAALQKEGSGVAPWNPHRQHHHHRQGRNSPMLDNCRHTNNTHRSSRTPSNQTTRRPTHQQRHQYSFDHTTTRRGSLDPPSVTSRSQTSYSAFSRHDRPRLPPPLPPLPPAVPQKPRLQIQVGSPLRPLRPQPTEPVSIVLQYSSELIAQQLCLIEREMLSQVQWYELVDAGWTKKKAPSTKASSPAASSQEPSKGSESSVASSIQINEASLVTAAAVGSGRRANVLESGLESGAGNRNDGSSVHRSEGTVTPTPRVGGGGGGGTGGPVKDEQRSKVVEDSLGIKRLVDRFNLTCQWVTSEIVRTKDLQQRVKVVEKFIRIAHTCYNHSNFSSLIQLMLGLQSHNVSRLNQTWARVRPQEMRIMDDLVEYTSPFHNWKHLRDDMKSIADEWGGSGSGGGGGGDGGGAAAVPAATEKTPPTSGGTMASSFFGKRRPSKDTTMAAAAAPAWTASPSGLGSKVSSSITHAKEKELKMGQQEKDAAAAKTSQPKGCIPFLGLYLSDLVFNAELPSYVDPITRNNTRNNQQQQQQPQGSQTSSRRPSTSTSITATSTSATPSSPSANSYQPTPITTTEPPPPPRLLVNIHKHRTTATIIKRILTFKTLAGRYPFEQDPDVRQALMAIQGLDPIEISRLSNAYEG